ncbi:MAG TPA: AraC family transcriptional regulator [Cyclobacteriaceae bacterium]|nr:AraC family transcriptional regulator [Cyclobacteriaceae bacterium]
MTSENTTPVYCLDTFSEKAKASSFYIEKLDAHLKNHSFVNAPHKHDFYLILYVTGGGGNHTIDFRTYDVHAGSFFLMSPGQVHSWKLDPGTDGFIIFFQNDFYRLHPGDAVITDFPFFHSLDSNPHVSNINDEMTDAVVKEMYREFHLKQADIRILRAYLDLLLLKLSRHYNGHAPVAPNAITFRIRKLEQLIDKNFIKMKKPGDYADLMNISPAHLNNLCKKHLGKTLSELINERIVLEAKRLFAYTGLSVGEVANRLKFSDPSYFIRFIRKNTGLTPEALKEQNAAESTIRPVE